MSSFDPQSSQQRERRATLVSEHDEIFAVMEKVYLAEIAKFDLRRPLSQKQLSDLDQCRNNAFIIASCLVQNKYEVLNNNLREKDFIGVTTVLFEGLV